MTLYVGLMSGTSMDGIDAALLEIDADGMRLLSAIRRDWPPTLQRRLRRLAEDYQFIGLIELGQLDTSVAEQFALAAEQLLRANELPPRAVRAVGSHGQTVLHQPQGDAPFTLQIGDPNVIAERLGVDVVADFRRRDVAAGGEGAPLMPAFHAAAFGVPGERSAVVNIGGIANVTQFAADGGITGFDTGPGNCLLDSWSRRHLNHAYDANGAWAATGIVQAELLARLLSEPYFSRPAPKSTGRETFSDAWLDQALTGLSLAPADVQATLSELTGLTIADSLRAAPGTDPKRVLICGGGAFNADLMGRLTRLLPRSQVDTTAAAGIAPEHVEAAGFAWLAHRYVSGLSGNLPAVTGARHPVPLGALYRGALL
ncbi:MAG TPA: anhydro-N-acetylmuramic acid kinase [Steroidobacteraceae bacterium]|nr:anhydro-N-acetylmuramic acid kinase [Steroidobacteraceae bacterium]